MQEKISHEELSEILNRIIGWIGNCDTKASTILGISGVVASIFLATDYVDKMVLIYKYMIDNFSAFSLIYLTCNLLSTGSCILGCAFLVGVLIGRANIGEYAAKGIQVDSLIFFASIAQNADFETYKEKLRKCSREEVDNDMISQIYICSKICSTKFHFYKIGLISSTVGFVIFLITVFVGCMVV